MLLSRSQLNDPECQVPTCTRSALAKLKGTSLCEEHLLMVLTHLRQRRVGILDYKGKVLPLTLSLERARWRAVMLKEGIKSAEAFKKSVRSGVTADCCKRMASTEVGIAVGRHKARSIRFCDRHDSGAERLYLELDAQAALLNGEGRLSAAG